MGKWEEVKLGDIAFTKSGGTPKRGFKAYWENGIIPWLKSGELSDNKNITKNTEFITEEAIKNSSAKIFPKGSLLLAMYGATAGKLGILGMDACTNQAVCSIQNKKGLFVEEFVYNYLLLIREDIIRDSFGGAQPNISKSYIDNIKIPLPPLPEQKRIVAKLDTLFADIDQAIGLLEENIAHTQALMGSVLDEEFGKLEATSKVVRISEIAEVKGGKRLPKGQKFQEFETDYPYIRVTDFSDDGSIKIENLRYISKEQHDQISRYIITNDDLYISIAGTIGKTGIIPEELNGANLTENAARLVYKDKSTIDNTFVYYYTKSDKFKRFVEDSTKQVAQPKLALTRLKEIKLALPSLKKQLDVVEIIKAIEFRLSELTKTETQKLTHLKSLKSSLLDQAFKGEL